VSTTFETVPSEHLLGGGGPPVRIAVVGLGYWGPSLVRNLHELPEAELVAVCDRRPDAVERIRRRYPGVPGTFRVEELLDDPTIEAIAVATPVSTHESLVEAALGSGKHVFVEKPLAASSDGALRLGCLADERELVLMPGHTFVYSPPVNAIHGLISQGEVGDVYFISTSRVNLGLHQPDVSVVADLGPHDFSILLYWLNEAPSHASALARSCVIPGTPDVAFINLEFRSGTVAHVELSWLAPSKLRRTTIVGSGKMVVYDDVSNEPVRVFDSGISLPDPDSFGEYRLSYRTGDIVSPRVDGAEPLELEMRDFCKAVRTGSRPRSTWELGLEVVRIVEAVETSLARRGARVEISTGLRRV
jgi:predicted dehydrogenase